MDKSKTVFPFLLTQADQGDLEKVKQMRKYKEDPEFRKAIDDALPKAPPAGTRHARFFEEEEPSLPSRHLMNVMTLENGGHKSLETSLHHISLVNRKGQM